MCRCRVPGKHEVVGFKEAVLSLATSLLGTRELYLYGSAHFLSTTALLNFFFSLFVSRLAGEMFRIHQFFIIPALPLFFFFFATNIRRTTCFLCNKSAVSSEVSRGEPFCFGQSGVLSVALARRTRMLAES